MSPSDVRQNGEQVLRGLLPILGVLLVNIIAVVEDPVPPVQDIPVLLLLAHLNRSLIHFWGTVDLTALSSFFKFFMMCQKSS